MLNSRDTFTESIKEAENLLAHFEALNSHPPPEELEVLKRAGLIMAMPAWETENCPFNGAIQRVHRVSISRLWKGKSSTSGVMGEIR